MVTREMTKPVSPAITQLVRLMEKDITSSGLRRGDPYLTVRKAADRFRVSLMTAHRGMHELSRRGILEQRNRSGTFVGPGLAGRETRVKVIHFFLEPSQFIRLPRLDEGLQEGFLEVLPEVSLQMNILPAAHVTEYLEEIFGTEGNRNASFGSVLCRASRPVRVFFSQHKLPAVALGHVEDDIDLPFVDRDQYGIGRQVVSFLLGKGHTCLGLLMYEHWNPGDNLLVAGAQESLETNRLKIQSVPAEMSLAKGLIKKVLMNPDRPTVLICRNDWITLASLEVAGELGLRIPQDLALVSLGVGDVPVSEGRPGITAMSYDHKAFGRKAAELLSRFMNGERPGNLHVEMPSHLIERETT